MSHQLRSKRLTLIYVPRGTWPGAEYDLFLPWKVAKNVRREPRPQLRHDTHAPWEDESQPQRSVAALVIRVLVCAPLLRP